MILRWQGRIGLVAIFRWSTRVHGRTDGKSYVAGILYILSVCKGIISPPLPPPIHPPRSKPTSPPLSLRQPTSLPPLSQPHSSSPRVHKLIIHRLCLEYLLLPAFNPTNLFSSASTNLCCTYASTNLSSSTLALTNFSSAYASTNLLW